MVVFRKEYGDASLGLAAGFVFIKNKPMNTFIKDNWFKIVAIIILLGALANNPYSYYQLLRWVVMIVAGYTAYVAYNNKKNNWAWVFGIMAVLFNPILPFYLSKDNWQLIDIIAAIIFLASIFNKKKIEENN